jgi:hypothetical protein
LAAGVLSVATAWDRLIDAMAATLCYASSRSSAWLFWNSTQYNLVIDDLGDSNETVVTLGEDNSKRRAGLSTAQAAAYMRCPVSAPRSNAASHLRIGSYRLNCLSS